MDFNTYVINLDTQDKRYESHRNKLIEVGIYPIRINAYYRKDIKQSEIDMYFHPMIKTHLPDTIIGSTYSHLQALKYFLENDTHNVALILEDDAFPLFYDISHLRKKLQNPDWDMMSLHCDGICPKNSTYPYIFSGSAAAYFITRDGARKLLKHKHKMYIDIETNNIKNFNKRIDKQNSFWTDEDGSMSGQTSTNRNDKNSTCLPIIKFISPYFVNRGEKTLCHIKNYKVFKVPGTHKELLCSELVLILSCIFSLIIIKKTLIR